MWNYLTTNSNKLDKKKKYKHFLTFEFQIVKLIVKGTKELNISYFEIVYTTSNSSSVIRLIISK